MTTAKMQNKTTSSINANAPSRLNRREWTVIAIADSRHSQIRVSVTNRIVLRSSRSNNTLISQTTILRLDTLHPETRRRATRRATKQLHELLEVMVGLDEDCGAEL